MTTGAKGKTKATRAKGKTKATGLKEFLSNLAIDAHKLGEFLHEPEAAMSAAALSEEDKAALRSGVAGMVAARLAGVPLDQAFMLLAYQKGAAVPAPPMIHPIQVQPQAAPMIHNIQALPMVHPMQVTPQYVVYPPQFVVQWPYYPQ